MEFYSKDNNIDKILPIINGEHKVSLRLIDWFVTNYSKKYYTTFNITSKSGNARRFKVYVDYKLKLKAYSKKRFDPFCRWVRITIPYGENTSIQTTLGQLNFFRWALEYRILDFIEKNLVDIENDMNKRNSSSKLEIADKLSVHQQLKQEKSVKSYLFLLQKVLKRKRLKLL